MFVCVGCVCLCVRVCVCVCVCVCVRERERDIDRQTDRQRIAKLAWHFAEVKLTTEAWAF